MNQNLTPDELALQLGQNVRAIRLDRNLDQRTVAERAGVSLHALKNLESGLGSTVNTLIRVVRVLDGTSWIWVIAPVASVNPLTALKSGEPRQRARRRSKRPNCG